MTREYGQTQVEGLNWACPDCGAVVEFFHGRPIHDRWHTELDQHRKSVIASNQRAEDLAVRIVDTRKALLQGGQTADIRARAAIAALDQERG